MTNEITTMAFCCWNYALTTAEGRHKRYLVVQLPRMKLNLRQQLSSTYDGVMLSKMSVSNGLVGNILLPTRLFPTAVDGLLPSIILICDGFLCCCDKLWPSLIAIFFVVVQRWLGLVETVGWVGWGRGLKIEVEVRIWVAGVVGFCCGLCCGFFFFFFWWLGVEVVVGDGGYGYGRG